MGPAFGGTAAGVRRAGRAGWGRRGVGAALVVVGGLTACGGGAAPSASGPAKAPADLEWVRIEGGAFEMGSSGGYRDEKPLRRVQVPTYHLTKSEVTNAQYTRCVAAGGCTPAGYDHCIRWDYAAGHVAFGPIAADSPLRQDDHPVVCVDWAQAAAFAGWARGRLPSEAEWEFAARSRGAPQQYPWGDAEASCTTAVMEGLGNRGCGQDRTWPVCSKPKGHSAQGVCDLAGSVWEWVADWFGPYSEAPSDGSARSRSADHRVLRGGSWYYPAELLRASRRRVEDPKARFDDLGFRVARSETP